MKKKLVAYFSASGHTKKVAGELADILNADLYEIVPEVPYREEDLDWTNLKSRSSVEMHDPEFRPAMHPGTPDTAQYDTVYLGFPIWWYVAPTIVNTFLEACDFSGKTVVLFATSGSSGFGKTAAGLKPSLPNDVKLTEGIVIKSGRYTAEDLKRLAAMGD